MRKLFISALMLFSFSSLYAQWKVTEVDKSDNTSCELVQILESENATFVFGTITNPTDDLYPYSTISRTTCVYVDDEPYKLVNSVNLPIYDEATPLYAQIYGHQKLNFIMEFEKFPVTDGFDLLEKESKHTEGTYNFYGVHVENVGLESMADDSFLDEYPSILYGNFTNEGKQTQYYMFLDFTLSCTLEQEQRDKYGQPDYLFLLTFENGSSKDLSLTFGTDVWITGHSVKKDGKLEEKKMKLIRPEDYETYFYQKDYQAARYIVNGDVANMSDAARQTEYSTTNSDAKAVLGLAAALGDLAIDKDVKKYLAEHPSDRPSPLRTGTIKAGEKKVGYVGIQAKKMDYYVLHLNLDGCEYKFSWKRQ